MFITHDGSHYILNDVSPGDIPEQYGFTHHVPVKYKWASASPMVAASVSCRATLDGNAAQEYADAYNVLQYIRSHNASTSSDIQVPCRQGLAYLRYQLAAIEFLRKNKHTLLADEMGLGKTIEVAGFINSLDEPSAILVVCPASLKLNWYRELHKWMVRDVSIQIVFGADPINHCDITIINYDLLDRHATLADKHWQVVIGDESSAIKNHKAHRTRIFCKLKADYRILLTGTPVPNRPVELFTSLRWLKPDIWGNWGKFVLRYCSAHMSRWGFDVSGASNLEELNKLIRSYVMMRRLKKDVLPELPPKFRQIIEIPCDDPDIAANEMQLFHKWRSTQAKIKMLERKAKKTRHEDEFALEISKLRMFSFLQFQELSKMRHSTALYKVPTVIAHISAALEAGKVVCFCHHKDVAEQIIKHFPGETVSLSGSDSAKDRDRAVQQFQENDHVRLFVGSLRAAGVGITLTASHHVIFAELDWTPSVISQAEDRLHRVGQKENILVQHLVLQDSVDCMMAKRIVAKQQNINKILK